MLAALAGREPWLAAARAKYASLHATTSADCFALVARAANTAGAMPDPSLEVSYRSLTREVGAACVWSALDYHYDASEIQGFTDEAYDEMMRDESRTPVFERAINARLAKSAERTVTVLDIGTGPHAVLALIAARAGARKVYAMEVRCHVYTLAASRS